MGTPSCALVLAPLLRSNHAPELPQKILVEEILREKEVLLSALRDEISELEFALQSLQNKYADLAADTTRYRSILSPVRRLPPEIIGEIFLYFVPSMHSESDFDLQNPPVQLPWKLGHICHLWRTISVSLSQLWSVMDLWSPSRHAVAVELARRRQDPSLDDDERAFTGLPVPPDPQDNLEDAEGFEIEYLVDYVEGCLPRSGNYPLSLRLWTPESAVFPVLDSLLKHSARWREIVLVSPPPTLIERLSQFEGDLRGLRRIAFTEYCDSMPIFRHAPNLTELTFLHVYLPFDNHPSIPWSQLTRYCEINSPWNHWGLDWHGPSQQRLASYRQLTNLLVLCMDSSSNFPRMDAPIILPNLRAASFRFSRTTSNVVRSFEMPALEEFSIEYSDFDHSDFGRLRASTFFPTSSPRLKVLRVKTQLRYLPSGQGDLEQAFEMFPELTEITIDVPSLMSNTDISRLVPYHGQLPLVPKLEIIRLSNRSFVHNGCEWRTLVDMLQARFRPSVPGISRLHTFEFATDDWSNDRNVMVGLQTLRMRNRWDIRVGGECRFPAWDDLPLQTA
ncbi:hypothetical protein B0H19DRAFT_1000363 [Mycena capillaripes]|nr:hypothetical protein B0H19DRAFT_1000363 [Mycena capillaripes]